MQFKIATIRYTKEVTARVFVPVDVDASVLYEIAEREAREGLRDYDDPEWDAELDHVITVDVAPEELRFVTVGTGRHVFKRPAPAIFDDGFLGVISDDHDRFVNAEDARWWQIDDEQLAELREKERRLQEINDPNQMHLFAGSSK